MHQRIDISNRRGTSPAPSQVDCQFRAAEIWRGASGRCYQHAVSSLLTCQPMPKATFILARRQGDLLKVLEIGRVEHDADTLNLATIRQRGATLGANEVHIHVLPSSEAERAQVVFDIDAALELRLPTADRKVI